MTRTQVSFLFILAVCFTIIAMVRGYRGYVDTGSYQHDVRFLAWDGSQIQITTNKHEAEKSFSEHTLPPELCPIFFHPIPLNYADRELLTTVPGIGNATAERILRKRSELGKIISNEQLMDIRGIGEKTAKIIEQYTIYDL
jgi:predicted DNA-binding helix-hairpin-helix protein